MVNTSKQILYSTLVLSALLGLAAPGHAQTTGKNAPANAPAGKEAEKPSTKVSKETIGAWAVQCSEVRGQSKTCNLAQTLLDMRTRRPLATWVIGKDKAGKLMASLTTPAGVSVPNGLAFAIGDQKATQMTYQTCINSGCISQFELTAAMVAQMQKSEKASVTVRDLSNREIGLTFSLKGFDRAYAAYQTEAG
jgi:invasion protein IalB